MIDTSLSSPVPITTLKVGSWANSDTGLSIAAPLIGTLTAAGGFDADVTLSDTGKTVDLNSAKIAGALDGSLTSGNVGTLSAGTVAGTWSGIITGTLTSLAIKAGGLNSSLTATTLGTLTIGGTVTGTISASTAKSIKISGGLSGSTLTFTGAKVGTLTVGGAISGETITAANGFTSITAGSISQSTITAGGTAGNTFANATAANLGGSTIGSIKVTSKAAGAFDDSSILAGSIGSVSLGNINTDDSSENNGTDVPFGIATRSLGSFSATFAAGPAHLGKSLLLNEEVLNAYLVQKGIVFGDFGIELES